MIKGSKAHSKEDEGLKAHSKKGRVRKRTTLNGRGLEGALKRGGKIQRFFRWPNSHGQLAQVD